MKKIMQLLMLSCKKATELIEKRALVRLSFREKIQLHLLEKYQLFWQKQWGKSKAKIKEWQQF